MVTSVGCVTGTRTGEGVAAYSGLSSLRPCHTFRRPLLQLILPEGVVERRSTDTLAINDAAMVKALRFIREKPERLMGVGDVARHAGICRRALEQRFQSLLGVARPHARSGVSAWHTQSTCSNARISCSSMALARRRGSTSTGRVVLPREANRLPVWRHRAGPPSASRWTPPGSLIRAWFGIRWIIIS